MGGSDFETACFCPAGIKVNFELSYDGGMPVNVDRKVGGRSKASTASGDLDFDDWQPSTSVAKKGPGRGEYSQRPVLHEIGHMLGLIHPGVGPGIPAGDDREYDADPGSLMGRGEIMRLDDFQFSFCDQIATPGQAVNYIAR